MTHFSKNWQFSRKKQFTPGRWVWKQESCSISPAEWSLWGSKRWSRWQYWGWSYFQKINKVDQKYFFLVEQLLKSQGCFCVNYQMKTIYQWNLSNVSKKVVINILYATGKTCLHYGAEKGHKDIVQLLLTSGASVKEKDKQSKYFIKFNSVKFQKKCFRILLSELLINLLLWHSKFCCIIRQFDVQMI